MNDAESLWVNESTGLGEPPKTRTVIYRLDNGLELPVERPVVREHG